MHHAVAVKLGVFQTGNHGEHPFLLRKFQIRLKSHQIVHRSLPVFPAQLYHCPRTVTRARISQSHRFQRSEPHGIRATGCQHLNGHTALIDPERILVAVVQRRTFCGNQRLVEVLVLFLVHGAVDIICIPSAVACRKEHFLLVQTLKADDGRSRIEKAEPCAAALFDVCRQCALCERSCGNHRGRIRNLRDHSRFQCDVGVIPDGIGGEVRKLFPIHRQRTAGSHCRFPGALHQQ